MDVFTEHLRTFLKVCELKSFTKAAQTLRKTQSTISTQVAVLEQDTGLQLLDRSQRPVHLTEAGEIFSSLARQIVNSTDQLVARRRRGWGGQNRDYHVHRSFHTAENSRAPLTRYAQGSA